MITYVYHNPPYNATPPLSKRAHPGYSQADPNKASIGRSDTFHGTRALLNRDACAV